MSQIKYLVSAFLLLLLLSFVIVVVDKLSSTDFIAEKPVVIDFIEPSNTSPQMVNSEGNNLYSANCATCHALDKMIEGPSLRGVENRGPWTERKNIIAWIKNPAATIKKFEYTRDLVAQFNGQIMPSFSNLTDGQIEAILDYLKQGSTAIASAK